MDNGTIGSLKRYQSGIDGAGFIKPAAGNVPVFFSSRVYSGDFSKAKVGMAVRFERYEGYEEARVVTP